MRCAGSTTTTTQRTTALCRDGHTAQHTSFTISQTFLFKHASNDSPHHTSFSLLSNPLSLALCNVPPSLLTPPPPQVKIQALKAAIMSMLGGEALPKVLMQVIRFCINTDDHQLKKLMMLYWEVVPKHQEPDGEFWLCLCACVLVSTSSLFLSLSLLSSLLLHVCGVLAA